MILKRVSWNIKKIIVLGGIIFIVVIVGGKIRVKGQQLEGLHFFENIISDGNYNFYIEAEQTADYTYYVDWFVKDASYVVYDMKDGELISEGSIRMREGYYPFIEMTLEKGNTYKVVLSLEDKYTYGSANIRLLLD